MTNSPRSADQPCPLGLCVGLIGLNGLTHNHHHHHRAAAATDSRLVGRNVISDVALGETSWYLQHEVKHYQQGDCSSYQTATQDSENHSMLIKLFFFVLFRNKKVL